VVSHPETEDRQMNATRVPCQVRQEMMAFLSKLATTPVCDVTFPGADGAEEPKCHPPAFRRPAPVLSWRGGTYQLYFKFIAPGQT
jgi:hypothetical protein